jgi:hypothetical protein
LKRFKFGIVGIMTTAGELEADTFAAADLTAGDGWVQAVSGGD